MASIKRKTEPFRFKQFEIVQEGCPMKVGTDGILLGAWAGTSGVKSVLDIGTGTGLIAIMMAQRTENDVQIDAVEIDAESSKQARDNMASAPWHQRLNCLESSIQDYAKLTNQRYDLIVSNPPFFSGGTISQNQDKNSVRHTVKLPHGDLLSAARKLMNEQGRLAIILPYIEGLRFKEMATSYHLYCRRLTEVRTKAGKDIERLLMEFELSPGELVEDELIIQGAGHNEWTERYTTLTRAFYTFME